MIKEIVAAASAVVIAACTPSAYVTEEELDLAAKLVWMEAQGESEECQTKIAEVLYNRLESGLWGETLTDVIYAQTEYGWEFSPAPYLDTAEPSEEVYEIVREVFENGSELDPGIMWFRANYYHTWAVDEFFIDNTYFSSSPWIK